jgi:hypothetical protein
MLKSTAPVVLLVLPLAACTVSSEDDSRDYQGNSTAPEVPSSVTWNGPDPNLSPVDAGSPNDPPTEDAASPPAEDASTPPTLDAAVPEPDAAVPEPDAAVPQPDATPPETCAYPSGPYGVNPGAVVAGSVSWVGYRPGSNTPENISPEEFLDCDGSRGINAIYVDYVAGWCSACQQSADSLAYKAAQWKAYGIVVLSLIIETSNYEPASVSTAEWWRASFDLQDTYVLADPSQHLFSADYLPYEMLINPRTMKIVETGELAESTILSLAQQNQ